MTAPTTTPPIHDPAKRPGPPTPPTPPSPPARPAAPTRARRAPARPPGAPYRVGPGLTAGALATTALAAAAALAAPASAGAQAVDSAPAAPGAPGRPAAETASADTIGADTLALPGLVVTATRVPLPREAIPTPVTVLTGAELRQDGIRTVAEALRTVPGAAVVRAGATGGQTSLFLRGGESDYVKVLVDGVPVNDPGGAFDFADLTTDQVERIEVVRGPVSVLYGSDAVSGVVQLFTRRGAGAPRLTVETTGGWGRQHHGDGRYGLADASATVSGATGSLSYTAGGARSWSAGVYPFNNERELTSASGRLAWTPAPGAEVAVTSRVTDSRAGLPTDGAGALVDHDARIDRRLWSTSVDGGWRFHERADLRIRLGLATRRQETVDRPDGPADTAGVFASELAWDVARRTADARVNVEVPGAVITGGVAFEEADAETRYASSSEWGPSAASADYRRSTTGYYAQLLARALDRVHLTAGARLDDSDAFGRFATYRLGAAVRAGPGTRLRGALGRAFREPTFDESFGSGFGDRGNPGLDPERSTSWELGVEQAVGGHVTLGATWFDQRFRDLIQFTFAPPEPDSVNYFNVGAALARGLELEARLARGASVLEATYGYLSTEVLDPGLATDASFQEGEPLLRRPTHTATLSGRYSLRAGLVGLTIRGVGEREDLDFAAGFPAPRVTLPPYATVDLVAEHALPLGAGAETEILLRIENALDADNESISGFPAPGRVLRLGARLRL